MRTSHTALYHRFQGQPNLQLDKPSIAKPGAKLFLQSPPVLRAALEPNLAKAMAELVEDGDVLSVTDPLYPAGVAIEIKVKLV